MSSIKGTPIEGQSHWCDGQTTDEEPCYQIVRNGSDHCEAGHGNRVRVLQDSAQEVQGPVTDAWGLIPASEPSPEIETMVDARAPVKPARDDYAVGRAVWEDWWASHHLSARAILRSRRDRRSLKKAGLAVLESKYPKDYVAVRVDSNARIGADVNASRSAYRDRVGLAYRDLRGDRPISGYSVLVKFAPSAPGTSFFWRELLPVPRISLSYWVRHRS